MTAFEWDQSMSIGIEDIDGQHKLLLGKLNDLAEALVRGRGTESVMKMLGFMERYADFHFYTEERCMEKNGFEGFVEHRHEHEHFRTVCSKIRGEIETEGSSEIIAHSVSRFLIDWLILHIKNTDKEFGTFMDEMTD